MCEEHMDKNNNRNPYSLYAEVPSKLCHFLRHDLATCAQSRRYSLNMVREGRQQIPATSLRSTAPGNCIARVRDALSQSSPGHLHQRALEQNLSWTAHRL
eukprot:gb/GFBE01006476.1/.p1 GENE.gb/GFBE01006476.1/~~gb/GFBE01006476.1/.p1  ORF type:complete len:100 (+),score=3.54 gb/GFBE01006476.1/:1-300(+)